MPTTLTGLLLFVVLLLPGFAYLVGKERVGTERRTSPFRETVSIVSASVTSELAVTIAAWPLWSWSLDVNRLVTDPGGYWQDRPGLLAGWALGLFAVATAGAFVATLPTVRGRLRWLGDYPHSSAVSGWWMLFENFDPAARKRVGCVLDDGSYISGTLTSFNIDAGDLLERDLILGVPILYRAPGGESAAPYQASAVAISAHRIVTMFVTYLDPEAPATSSLGEAEEAPPADAE